MVHVNVLVCDDVVEMRSILCEVLGDAPAIDVVGEADNGSACVELARRLVPDVVLLDVSMPGMDGLEAIRLIASELPDTGIVIFSGFGGRWMREIALGVGADRYLEKGSELSELISAVVEVADARHGALSATAPAKRALGPPCPP